MDWITMVTSNSSNKQYGSIEMMEIVESQEPNHWYLFKVVPPPVISWFIIPINYRYNPHKPQL